MKIISKIKKYIGSSLNVINQVVKFENKSILEFEFIERDEVALIIPLKTNDITIILEQYRASINDFIIEFPAGKKEKEETIIETAIRELNEETGYKAKEIEKIGCFLLSPHFTNEKINVFIATGLEFETLKLSEKEIISPKEISLAELFNYQERNLLLDAKTSLALTMLKNFKNGKK